MPRPSELQLSASAAAMRIPIQRQFRGGHLGSFHSALRFPRDHRPASKMGLPRVFSWPFFGCDEAPCGNFRDVEIVPCHSSHPLAQRPGTPLAVKSHSSRVSHSPSTQAPQASLSSFSGSLAVSSPALRYSFLLFHSLHCRALASILPLSTAYYSPRSFEFTFPFVQSTLF